MSNKVFLNDKNIVECHVVGDQTAESVRSMGKKIEAFLADLKNNHKRQLVLDDLTAMGAVPPAARKMVVNFAKDLPYDKLAMLGKGGVLRFGANMIIRISGRRSKLQYFDNREQALRWLQD